MTNAEANGFAQFLFFFDDVIHLQVRYSKCNSKSYILIHLRDVLQKEQYGPGSPGMVIKLIVKLMNGSELFTIFLHVLSSFDEHSLIINVRTSHYCSWPLMDFMDGHEPSYRMKQKFTNGHGFFSTDDGGWRSIISQELSMNFLKTMIVRQNYWTH